MTSVRIAPLTVMMEYAGGNWAAFPAFDPALVSYGSDQESALAELRLFLAEFLPKLGAAPTQQFALAGAYRLDRVPVVVPRGSRERWAKIKTPLSLATVVLPARAGGVWALVPALGHVCFVPPPPEATSSSSEGSAAHFHQTVARDLERLSAAADLEAARYLRLLPALDTQLERIEVELATGTRQPDGKARKRAAELEREDARKLLASVGRELAPERKAEAGSELLHRQRQLAALRSSLTAPRRSSVVLVGAPGSGKSAIVRALAAVGLNGPVFSTSGAELVAGRSLIGEIEQQLDEVLRAAELLDAVLYFESMDDLFAGRASGHQDLGSALGRAVAEGRVRIAGELTPEQFDRLQHENVGFFSYVQKLDIEPLNEAQTLDILRARARLAERRGRTTLSDEGLRVLLRLVKRYEPYRVLPGKAVQMADELASAHSTARSRARWTSARPGIPNALGGAASGGAQPDQPEAIGPAEVYAAVSARTGVPEFLLRDELRLAVDEVVRFFEARLVGQRAAIRQVAETICRIKADVASSAKPLATFLFVGPTGVGKTELAKAAARYLFGSSDRLARFDMSEYADELGAERLIRGTADQDGVLTRRIRQQPFTLLLLDEIEKAHPSVFDLLLQVCGEARLSDARGLVTHFENAIIIMTSNLGAQPRLEVTGFGGRASTRAEHYLRQVHEHFRPEFINRLDRIIHFEHLSQEEIQQVARLSVDRLVARQGFEQRNIALRVSEFALARVAESGFSPSYGARGLRRHLEQVLVANVAAVISAMGRAAAGAEVAIHSSEELTGEWRGSALGWVERDGLIVVARARPVERVEDVSAVVAMSRLRRHIARVLRLPAIGELRERLAELDAELGSAERWRRSAGAVGEVFSKLTAERERLANLLLPLDRARQELDDIEALVIGALYEGDPPALLQAEARAAYERFLNGLVPALVALTEEHAITLVIQELDGRRVLHDWLLPLFAWISQRGWEACVHIDRDPREPGDDWPKSRRWGPPRELADYLEKYARTSPDERPFRSVLVRIRGTAAGALLGFAPGRYRYSMEGATPGELWVRRGPLRFELSPEDWDDVALTGSPAPALARGAPLRLTLGDGDAEAPARRGELELVPLELRPEELFARWEAVILPWMLEALGATDAR